MDHACPVVIESKLLKSHEDKTLPDFIKEFGHVDFESNHFSSFAGWFLSYRVENFMGNVVCQHVK